jgi:hypothetical protein
MAKLKLNEIKNAGEHFVCAELSRMGIISARTSGNAAYVDILATVDGSKSISIQVKASQGRDNSRAWWVGKKKPKTSDSLFYIFVNVWEDEKQPPEYFIVPSTEVEKRVNWDATIPRFNLRKSEVDEFKNNWEIIKSYLV